MAHWQPTGPHIMARIVRDDWGPGQQRCAKQCFEVVKLQPLGRFLGVGRTRSLTPSNIGTGVNQQVRLLRIGVQHFAHKPKRAAS